MFQLYKMPDSEIGKMLTGYIDYYGEGDVPSWVNPKKKIDTEEKRNMWNKLNVELGRMMTKNLPAIRDGRGIDIIRHELGWYPRSKLKKKREAINKYSKEYFGIKPFKIGQKKTGEKALYELMAELRGK
jgi:hypothetical protein